LLCCPSGDEIFVAGAGNDTLIGNGGMDVLNAGAGDDTITINASNIAALRVLLMLVKSRLKLLPSSFSVSMLPPPSTRARLPVPVCANAAMLLATTP
jgi:hypothetical protein